MVSRSALSSCWVYRDILWRQLCRLILAPELEVLSRLVFGILAGRSVAISVADELGQGNDRWFMCLWA